MLTSLLMAARGKSPTSMFLVAVWHSAASVNLQHDTGTLNCVEDNGAAFQEVFGMPISGAVVS